MANARIARFVTEAAPPQFVSVMRHRASKMLDTINEEERDVGSYDPTLYPKSSPSSSSSTPLSASSSINATKAKYLLKEVQRCRFQYLVAKSLLPEEYPPHN